MSRYEIEVRSYLDTLKMSKPENKEDIKQLRAVFSKKDWDEDLYATQE